MIFDREHRAALEAARLTIGTSRADTGAYVGVLRRGRAIVLECGHVHHNRDTSTRSGGTSASDCVRELVLAARRPVFAEHRAQQIATAWQRLGSWGTASTVERARAAAPGEVATFRELVARAAEMLGE